MPYIEEEQRKRLEHGDSPKNVGELNYMLSSLALDYWERNKESYQTYNDLLGVIEAVKLELYRTMIGPYEQNKSLVNGNLKNQFGLAWAAGFFDGEGHIGYSSNLHLGITQKEPLLLLRFSEAVGGLGYLKEVKTPKNKPHWVLGYYNWADIIFIVSSLWTHLGLVKRKQALLAIQKWKLKRNMTINLPVTLQEDWPDNDVLSSLDSCKTEIHNKKANTMRKNRAIDKTMWINNGTKNSRISPNDPIPNGFVTGKIYPNRKFKKK